MGLSRAFEYPTMNTCLSNFKDISPLQWELQVE